MSYSPLFAFVRYLQRAVLNESIAKGKKIRLYIIISATSEMQSLKSTYVRFSKMVILVFSKLGSAYNLAILYNHDQ